MPFCRATLSAKRFIAAVGGRTPVSPPITPLRKDGPPAPPPSVSLPMMRWATSHTASIAPTISCLPIKTSSSEHSSCAVTATHAADVSKPDEAAGLVQAAVTVFGGIDVLINNVGGGGGGARIADSTDDDWRSAMGRNLTPGSTSAGSACLRTPNSDRPVSAGRMTSSPGKTG